jgi:hypothetical protein
VLVRFAYLAVTHAFAVLRLLTTVWADERAYYPLHAQSYTPASYFPKGRGGEGSAGGTAGG